MRENHRAVILSGEEERASGGRGPGAEQGRLSRWPPDNRRPVVLKQRLALP